MDVNDDIVDAAFTKTFGCKAYPGGHDQERRDLRFDKGVPLGENTSFLIDFDRQDYSARFFAFLMSESAVAKATVYERVFHGMDPTLAAPHTIIVQLLGDL